MILMHNCLAPTFPRCMRVLPQPFACMHACRLVYDERGHFQAQDEGPADPYDFYDYDDGEAPPGCTLGSQSSFLLSNVPSNETWSTVAVNKAAFTISQQALPYCAAPYSAGGTQALALLPYVCTAVPARVATSSGSFFALFPVAAVIVGLMLIGTAVASVVMVFGAALWGCMGRRQ